MACNLKFSTDENRNMKSWIPSEWRPKTELLLDFCERQRSLFKLSEHFDSPSPITPQTPRITSTLC